MKIPKTVMIGAIIYKVEYEQRLNNGEHMAYGHIDWENHVIRLSEGLQDAQGECHTLLHEIIHGVAHEYGLDVNEETTDFLASGLHQVIVDNPKMFKD